MEAIEAIQKEIHEIKQDSGILMEEFELSEEAIKELEKARKAGESEYIDIEEID